MVKNNKGFTFVDVVCAMAILALVALPICSGFLTAAKTNQRLQEKTEIVTLLNNELTKITSSGKFEFQGNPIELTKFASGEGEKPESSYIKTLQSGMKITIDLTPTMAIGNASKLAYVTVSITYDNGTPEDTSDDYSVTGVWAA